MLTEYKETIENLKDMIIKSNDINEVLLLAKFYGKMQWMNQDGIYYDEELENSILNLIIKEIDIKQIKKNFKRNTFATLIASELYNQGGHTKVIIKWLKLLSPFYSHRLILTRGIPKSIKEKISKFDVNIYQCKFYGLEKIKEIVEIAKNSKFVILHIHPDDIIASIASKILSFLGITIVFYNHADHVFSYAINSADIVCEISSFGMKLSQKTGRVKGQQCLLGIPIFSQKNVDFDYLKKKFYLLKNKSEKIILSCGSTWKYEPYDNISFDRFVDILLTYRKDIKFIIVGPTGKEKWWHKIRTKWQDRVKFTGPLSYKKYKELLERIDIYVDSFPITGGTAFPEALLAGIPCVGLQLPVQGYSCIDSLRVRDIEELIRCIEEFIEAKEDRLNLMFDTLDKLITFNSEEAFYERVIRLYSLELNKIRTIPCLKSEKEIDCFWLEKLWKKEKNVLIPPLDILNRLSYYKKIKFLKNLLKIRNYNKTYNLRRILVSTMLGRRIQ